MSAPAPRFLSAGFRFFFLAAALFAIAAMAAWLGWLAVHAAGGAVAQTTFDAAPHLWHGHEMIFGYAVAVIAGFFMTAVPNWTGTREAGSCGVAIAAAVWLAGRIAVWFSAWVSPWLVAVADLAFLPLLASGIAINLLRRPKPQNVALLGLLVLLLAGNVMAHLEWVGLTGDTATAGLWLGVLAICALISVIGGRITPAFTRNALLRRGIEDGLPVMRAWADLAGIVSAVALGPLVAFGAPEWLTGGVALVAAVANAVRLQGWRSFSTLGEPIVWALHLGFAMLVTGYAALAASWLTGILHPVAAFHWLAIGTVGGMPLAMMTRAPLGHTGRPLVVGRAAVAAYLLMVVATVIRVAGSQVFPADYYTVMFLAGGAWIAAFACYLAGYWHVLTGPDAREASIRESA
ncbi:MAG: NnrS family protein [Rhodobiaceae bacterium]|nr:NnrS family protein [Rhodobiaceae bacterium]